MNQYNKRKSNRFILILITVSMLINLYLAYNFSLSLILPNKDSVYIVRIVEIDKTGHIWVNHEFVFNGYKQDSAISY
jgi:hypothetical protein